MTMTTQSVSTDDVFLVAQHDVLVHRDAQTVTPTQAFAHEVPVFVAVFGRENVQVLEELREVQLDLRDEYERLVQRFGPQVVQQVYGNDDGGFPDRLRANAQRTGGAGAATARRGGRASA